jgi:hypothetical protein
MQDCGAMIHAGDSESTMAISLILPFLLLAIGIPVQAAEPSHRHESGPACGAQPDFITAARFEGVQLETSDIAPYELLFEGVLKAQVVFKVDHPQVDHLRGYCYRDVLVVIRQDLKTPRPTGWVQINFAVPDVSMVKGELEQVLSAAQAPFARLRFKPDVPRSNCRVSRLELSGPDGFMIGFDQVKPETCKGPEPRKEG